jgi:hypothetical protein
MTTRAQTTTVLRMGGWAAYANGVVSAVPAVGAERHLAIGR